MYLTVYEESSALPGNLDRSYNTRTGALNKEAFHPSGQTWGGETVRHVGRRNDSACWNQGSEMCVPVLYAHPTVGHVAG